ncbi:MAG: hypothetical protein GWP91_25505 [Rhodobacterales bacterium]|nr:hypothetical protein [Rhodobacterales bacterium]
MTPLAGIPGEIISLTEHFFTLEGLPHLLLVVQRRSQQGPSVRAQRRASKPAKKVLSDLEQPRFERLRAWRNGRAVADGVPPYVVLSNRMLTDLAIGEPDTIAGLRGVRGVGERKAALYGAEILAVLSEVDPLES